MRKDRLITLLICGVLLFSLFAGCGTYNQSEKQTQTGGMTAPGDGKTSTGLNGEQTITYAVFNEPTTVDPSSGSTGETLKVLRSCYEPLVKETIGEVAVEPCLATDWTTSDDQKEWIFNLRQGVKFHDGSTLTAKDVKATIERTLSIGLGGGSLISSIESVEEIDDYTVKIKNSEPNVYFLYRLAKLPIVSSAAIAAHEKDNDRANEWLSRNTAGTGPFQLAQKDWIPGEYLQMERFQDYWGGWQDDNFDYARLIFTNDATVQMQMIERGEIDKHGAQIIDSVERLKKNPNLEILTGKGLETDIITFNTQKYPLDNKDFRLALSYALDYEAVQKDIFGGYSDIPRGFLPVSFDGFNDKIQSQSYNMDKAKEYLKKSGVDTKGLTLTMHLNKGRAPQKSTAMLLQDSLRSLDINLEITEVQWAVLSEEYTKSETAPHMSILEMGAYTGDPIYFLSSNFHTKNIGGPYNWSFWSNSEFDSLLDKAATLSDANERNSLLERAQEILIEEAPAIYYASPQKLEVISKRVKNYVLHPLDYYYYINFYSVRVEK